MEKEKNGNYLIYEGEYKKGKRNGKGREYDYKHNEYDDETNNIIFECEYLNDEKINGKEKEYDYKII